MSGTERIVPTRTISERALAEMPGGLETCLIALEVARDLRSGVIPREEFNMRWYSRPRGCGTACCLASHIALRLEDDGLSPPFINRWASLAGNNPAMAHLVAMHRPSDPLLAADAIERYIYTDVRDPWESSI